MATPDFSIHRLDQSDQSAAINTEARPTTSKKVMTQEDDGQHFLAIKYFFLLRYVHFLRHNAMAHLDYSIM